MADELLAKLAGIVDLDEQTKANIAAESLTLDSFLLLGEDDLKELGMKMGHRKLIMQWISQTVSHPTSAAAASNTAACTSNASMSVVSTNQTVSSELNQPISEILQKYTKASYNIKGQQLVVKLQSGEYYSTAERLFFVKVLGRHLMKHCSMQDRPTTSEKLALAQRIIETFPVLRDSSAPNGYETFFDPKSHSGYLERYIRQKRSRDPNIATMWTHAKTRVPPALEHSVDNERLLRERRPNSSNTDELLELMHKTRSARRAWVLADSPTITAILQRYPRLQDMNRALREEFLSLVPEACDKTLRDEWCRVRDGILERGREVCSPNDGELHELMNSVADDYDEEKKTEVSFRTLPYLLRAPPKRGKKRPKMPASAVEKLFFVDIEGEAGVHEVLEQLRGTTQPVLFRIQSEYWVKVDHSVIQLTDASCFADIVELLLACYFVFNVEYDHELVPMYDMIECVLGIRKRAKCCSSRELLHRLLH